MTDHGSKSMQFDPSLLRNRLFRAIDENYTVPLPELVNSADIATGGSKAEAYEGVLVEIEDVEVTNPDLMNGEFEVSGGLRLDDLFFTNMDWPSVSMGDTFSSVIGVIDYSFDNHKLAPRSANDLTN